MSAIDTLARLRAFLRGFAAILFAGTVLELLSAKHWEDPIQFLPFALCGVGLLTLALEWKRPGPRHTAALRAVMTVIALASLIGVYEHVMGNIGFLLERQPDATFWQMAQAGVTGRAPLLASGALAVAAVVAILATFALAPAPIPVAAGDERAWSGAQRVPSRSS